MDQAAVGASLARLDTFPKLLIRNARERGERPAYREKEFGIWQAYSWADSLRQVRALACGLHRLGVKRGDKLSIVGDNRPRLYWAIAAAQSLGCTVVPAYQDAVADEFQYVLDHAEVSFVVAEDQEQVDKILAVRDRLPKLRHVVFVNPRGMRNYVHDWLTAFDQVLEHGRTFDAGHPGFFEAEVAKGQPDDIGVIAYTSGTTGRPKGVMLSFANLVPSAQASAKFEGLREDEDVLAYLPMAWIGDHFFSYAQSIVVGFTVNCPESAATVTIDLKELAPTYFFAPPRIFETLLTQTMVRMEDANAVKRWLFKYFMALARRSGVRILEGKPVSALDRLLYVLGGALVYGPLKNALGLSRIRLAYTAGEAIGPDIFDFFRSLGINLKQLYGQTESSVMVCIQRNDDVRADTVGPPAPGVEVRIDDRGEVLYRSPGVFVGYFKNPEATAETKTKDGWVKTGDAGIFTQDGHLRIIDRAKDVGRLKDGSLFAPKYIENKLKFFPSIMEAVTHGSDRDFVAAFINIDLRAVGNWAERNGLAYTSYSDLASRPEVYAMIKGQIEQVNRDLAADPQLAGSQIRRFLILHKELDADDGELTRTRKVRRNTVAERYAPLIDALYSDRDEVEIESKVAFEDGRVGTMKARLKIAGADAVHALKQAG
ncbi:MAG: long-chain fatty acid--CoA ligase [Alphaproteobacteria bacterium]|nr:long-chain fatty acid--CoA ligase [Alphaproteobacteria bacterium]